MQRYDKVCSQRMKKHKQKFRWLLALAMVGIGIQHFTNPAPFEKIVPAYLPLPLAIVYVSGLFEILCGIGLLILPVSRIAAWGLIALYIAVFPANVNMAVNSIRIEGTSYPLIFNWARLPFQALFIAWAYWFTHKDIND